MTVIEFSKLDLFLVKSAGRYYRDELVFTRKQASNMNQSVGNTAKPWFKRIQSENKFLPDSLELVSWNHCFCCVSNTASLLQYL